MATGGAPPTVPMCTGVLGQRPVLGTPQHLERLLVTHCAVREVWDPCVQSVPLAALALVDAASEIFSSLLPSSGIFLDEFSLSLRVCMHAPS